MRAVAIGLVAAAVFAPLPQAQAQSAARETARLDAMVERPLFSPTRRQPPAPPTPFTPPLAAPPQAPLPQPPPDVTLNGVISGGGGGVALLRRPQDQAPMRVARGGVIDGWTVAEIRPRAVVLRRDTRSVTVELQLAPR